MTFAELLIKAQKIFTEHQIDNPRLDARILLNFTLDRGLNDVFDAAVSKEQQKLFFELIKRRCQREPVSRIIGKKGFWKYDFCLSKATLDPRPDTETIIESFLKEGYSKDDKLNILDLGTGSGCIAISLAGEFPKAEVLGIDIAEEAIKTASYNAKELKVKNCEFLTADWNNWQNLPSTKFDIIVSNPPYIKENDIAQLEPEVKVFDPIAALLGGSTGLEAYKSIAKILPHITKPKSHIFLEIGEGQEKEVRAIMEEKAFVFKSYNYDLAQKIRCLVFYR